MHALGLTRVHGVGPDVGTSAFLFAAKDQPALFESLIVGSGATSANTTGATLRDLIFAPTLADLEKLDGAVVALAAVDGLLNEALPSDVRADYSAASAGRRFVEAVAYVRWYPRDLAKLGEALHRFQRLSSASGAKKIHSYRRSTPTCFSKSFQNHGRSISTPAISCGSSSRKHMRRPSWIGSKADTLHPRSKGDSQAPARRAKQLIRLDRSRHTTCAVAFWLLERFELPFQSIVGTAEASRNPVRIGQPRWREMPSACAINRLSSGVALPKRSRIVQCRGISRIWRATQNKTANSYVIEIAV
jgi:hypothetical protein